MQPTQGPESNGMMLLCSITAQTKQIGLSLKFLMGMLVQLLVTVLLIKVEASKKLEKVHTWNAQAWVKLYYSVRETKKKIQRLRP